MRSILPLISGFGAMWLRITEIPAIKAENDAATPYIVIGNMHAVTEHVFR